MTDVWRDVNYVNTVNEKLSIALLDCQKESHISSYRVVAHTNPSTEWFFKKPRGVLSKRTATWSRRLVLLAVWSRWPPAVTKSYKIIGMSNLCICSICIQHPLDTPREWIAPLYPIRNTRFKPPQLPPSCLLLLGQWSSNPWFGRVYLGRCQILGASLLDTWINSCFASFDSQKFG